MFKINQCVSYSTSGVCKIIDLKKENFCGEEKDYYLLKPLYSSDSTIYVPCDNENLVRKMKEIISIEEVYKLIEDMPSLEVSWIENERLRSEYYTSVLKDMNYIEIVGLVKTLYIKRKEIERAGKKFRVHDKKMLDLCEKLINEEFAKALNIAVDHVVDFIKDNIKE